MKLFLLEAVGIVVVFGGFVIIALNDFAGEAAAFGLFVIATGAAAFLLGGYLRRQCGSRWR